MRKIFISLALFAGLTSQALAQNYNATAGAGLVFGANLVGGVLYPQQNMCDPTTPARCIVVDASGRITVLQGTSPWVVSNGGTFLAQVNGFTSWAGGTLGAMATYGTSPGAVLVPGVNAFVTNTTALGQAVMASSSPVVIASNQSAVPVTLTSTTITGTVAATQSGTWTVQPGNTANTTAWLVRPNDGTRSAIIDPCEANLQTYTPISITTATTTRIVAPSASNKTYICSLFLTSAAADNIGIVEGTGGTCGAGTAGVIGGTTAANGPNFAANSGIFLQAGGKVAVAQTAGTNVDLCLITSAATPLAGGIKFVQAP